MENIKVMFMGTPDFALPCLEMLCTADGVSVISVVTQPDKPKGRGYKLVPPPVKVFAEERGMEVVQPSSVKTKEFSDYVKGKNPDLIVVIAYGKIIPKEILNYPKYGCINVHASLLPKYRGAAPVQWCVINGEKETGVTTMMMDEGLDTGDMLVKRTVGIDGSDTAGTLFKKLERASCEALSETIDRIKTGTLERTPQDNSAFTYAPMINSETAMVDFYKTSNEVKCLIMGLNPSPGAKISIGGKIVKFYEAETADKFTGEPGEVIECEKRLVIACGDKKAVEIMKIQPQGKKVMGIADFLRGNNIFVKGMIIAK